MSGRRTFRFAVASLATAALAAGALVASGTGSTARTWAWDAGVPGDPLAAADGRGGLRLLVANDDFALVAREEEGTVEVGAGASDDVTLQPLAELAGEDPLVAFSATTPEGGPQQLVGVARSDVADVEAVLRDGTTVELPLNEWRAFSYMAATPSEAAIGLVARSSDGGLGVVRLPQTTAVTQQAPAPTAYTISNRGRLVGAKASNANLLGAHPFRLFLLTTRNGRAFYRVQVTPDYTCWGSGKAAQIGKLGTLACPNLVGAYPLQFQDLVFGRNAPTIRAELRRVGGIAADQAATVALLDGSARQIATAPVVDNVFSFAGPFPKERGFPRIVAFDAAGNRLGTLPDRARHQTPPAGLFGPRATKVSSAQLHGVLQRASANGVRVSVGRNGVALFDSSRIARRLRDMLAGGHAGYNCFVVTGQNVRKARSVGVYSAWRPTVAFRMLGVEPPFDGCDIQGTYGHRWRDGRGTHSLVEVAFSEQGRRYFADRATARDLALFVRSRMTRELRTLTGRRLVAALRRTYGDRIMVLPNAETAPPSGLVGVHVDGARTAFNERSSTGDRLYVALEQGKIVDENVRGLAFVF